MSREFNKDEIRQWAAIHLAGSTGEVSSEDLERLLAGEFSPEVEEMADLADLVAEVIAAESPMAVAPDGIKEKLMADLGIQPDPDQMPSIAEGFSFVQAGDEKDWTPLPVAGAFFKLLSMDQSRGYAVVLGKLEPGTRYPAHDHIGPESILVLSGDLWIGDREMTAGDFHSAAAGTRHDVNSSRQGCTILAVLTIEDLQAQMSQFSDS